MRSGDRGLLITGVDHPAAYLDGSDFVGHTVADLRLSFVVADELVLCQQSNAARREQSLIEYLLEVLCDLRPRRLLVVAGVVAVLRDAILAEPQRVDAVERRRGVEAYERITVPRQ